LDEEGWRQAPPLRDTTIVVPPCPQGRSLEKKVGQTFLSDEKCEVMAKKDNFENALKRLEEIVQKLEGGELSLDESLKLFEEGIELSRLCTKRLSEAETKVEKLIKLGEKEFKTEPLEVEEREEEEE
jgi:exodeoxyribonuclease VII small subunit